MLNIKVEVGLVNWEIIKIFKVRDYEGLNSGVIVQIKRMVYL